MSRIKTRLLILSDTHGTSPALAPPASPSTEDELATATDLHTITTGYRHPLPTADVVLHCGDLTKRSTVSEFDATFSMLRSLHAPLKLVIAGNHDWLLDQTFVEQTHEPGELDSDKKRLRRIMEDAERDGVRYLTEGTYRFALQNGAAISVYASPYTPAYGTWGFQYLQSHDFAIPDHVDVAMTHGPPYDVLDQTGIKRFMGGGLVQSKPDHAGCKHLFGAVARARPRIHCFGHIHEGWGAYYCTWAEGDDTRCSAANTIVTKELAVAESKSRVLHTLQGLKPVSRIDTSARTPEARQILTSLSRQRGVKLDLTENPTLVEKGRHTLFLNGAIMDIRYRPSQLPWIVDLDLSVPENLPE